MKSNIKRVLVADDHSLFRRGIVGLLEAADYEVVAQANDGAAAVENTRKLQPDLVLLDISMPKMNGLEALKIIKAEFPAIYVVMLTLSEENSDLLEAVKHGANGYLMKDLNYHEFIDMLSGLENGEAAITRKTASQLMVSLADNTNQLAEPNSPEQLTPREIELLKLVGHGLSNKAISQDLSISMNTVKYHLRNILRKLHAQNRTEAVTQAIKWEIIDPL